MIGVSPRTASARGTVPLLDRPLDKTLGKRTADQLAKQGVRTAGGLRTGPGGAGPNSPVPRPIRGLTRLGI